VPVNRALNFMNEALNPQRRRSAALYANDDFICVQSCAGYRRVASDPFGGQALLPRQVRAEELGCIVLDTLNRYRVLSENEIGEFFDVSRIAKAHSNWETALMQRYGYKTKKQLYNSLVHVMARLDGETLSTQATQQERQGGWAGMGPMFSTRVEAGAGAIGSMMLEALAACK
jgi:hypothetical protein